MSDPFSHSESATPDEPCERQHEGTSASNEQNEEDDIASTAAAASYHETRNGASGHSTGPDEQTRDRHDTPHSNLGGGGGGGGQNGAPEYHQEELDFHFRQLRDVLPRTAAAPASLAVEEELGENHSGGPNDEEDDTGREEEPPALLEHARRYILALEREQRVLEEQIHELQHLLDD